MVTERFSATFFVLGTSEEIHQIGRTSYLAHEAVYHGGAVHPGCHFAVSHRLGEEGVVALVDRHGGEGNGFLPFTGECRITGITVPMQMAPGMEKEGLLSKGDR